jgi:hypothetical protein
MASPRTLTIFALLALAPLASCARDTGEDDAIDDSFPDPGKGDGAGFAEGSVQALAVLRVVNEADVSVLRGSVHLTTLASTGIVAHRAGADGVLDTIDDDKFDTLAELDAIPYVGPVSFQKLLAYATAQGYLSPGWNVFVQDLYQTAPGGYVQFDVGLDAPGYSVGSPTYSTFSITADALPDGATFSGPRTMWWGQHFAWLTRADQAGDYTITFTGTDGTSSASKPVVVHVGDLTHPAFPSGAVSRTVTTMGTTTVTQCLQGCQTWIDLSGDPVSVTCTMTGTNPGTVTASCSFGFSQAVRQRSFAHAVPATATMSAALQVEASSERAYSTLTPYVEHAGAWFTGDASVTIGRPFGAPADPFLVRVDLGVALDDGYGIDVYVTVPLAP